MPRKRSEITGDAGSVEPKRDDRDFTERAIEKVGGIKIPVPDAVKEVLRKHTEEVLDRDVILKAPDQLFEALKERNPGSDVRHEPSTAERIVVTFAEKFSPVQFHTLEVTTTLESRIAPGESTAGAMKRLHDEYEHALRTSGLIDRETRGYLDRVRQVGELARGG